MIKYIVKRLLLLIPVLIGITFLSFAMMRLAGGDAVTYMYKMQEWQFRRDGLLYLRCCESYYGYHLSLPGSPRQIRG